MYFLNLRKVDVWKYVPNQIVSKHHMSLNSTPYIHQLKTKIEKLANKNTWEELQCLLKLELNDNISKKNQIMEKNKVIILVSVIIDSHGNGMESIQIPGVFQQKNGIVDDPTIQQSDNSKRLSNKPNEPKAKKRKNQNEVKHPKDVAQDNSKEAT
jgi:hypothetical protein